MAKMDHVWIAAIAMILVAVALAGCAAKTTAPEIVTQAGCSSKDCFAAEANNCSDISIQVSESFGTVKYSSSGCVFTKTIVGLNQNESADMKAALQGKSMTCVYERGKFDSGWLSSLVYGLDGCEGELKEIISRLVLFS